MFRARLWYGAGEGEELLGAVPVQGVGSGVGESTEEFWPGLVAVLKEASWGGGELAAPGKLVCLGIPELGEVCS